MRGHSDEWVENRILWAAKKNGLPTGMTSIYKEADTLPSGLTNYSSRSGIPVLAVVGGENRWTLLGTNKIITNENCDVTELDLDNISDVRMPSEQQVPRKHDCDFLLVEDDGGSVHHVWVPSGREFFAIINIVLMIINLKKN
jgi:hypothetical protein